MNKWGKKSLSYLNKQGFNATLKNFLLEIETKFPFEVTITDTFRTPEEQKKCFDGGFSKCDGYKIKSRHQTGNAFDIVPSAKLWSSSRAEFDQLSKFILDEWFKFQPAKLQVLKLEWGGNWEFLDLPHFEIKDYN